MTSFKPREKRQRERPVTSGAFCDWCPCANCAGGKAPIFPVFNILLADGTHMCDVCWSYPPCGIDDDCEEYVSKGSCSHRPPLAPGAEWIARSEPR